jgi:EAL domain-containing protein (putative c-di-GMP-specific phosphodiesterase class I)
MLYPFGAPMKPITIYPFLVASLIAFGVIVINGTLSKAFLELAVLLLFLFSGALLLRSITTPVNKDALRALQLKKELVKAIKGQQLVLYYQLKKDINTGAYVGVESLVRWNHPMHGLLYPNSFIYLTEASSNIMALTNWIINQSLTDFAKLIKLGYQGTISINISPHCVFKQSDFDNLRSLLSFYALDPHRIIFEITESSKVLSQPLYLDMFKSLHEIGINLSIDDFGAGTSSLGYLRTLRIAELKVDKAFVMSMLSSKQDFHIVKSVVQLAAVMGCISVAEGVESVEIENALKDMGCTIAQGYYISEALALDDLINFLNLNDPV